MSDFNGRIQDVVSAFTRKPLDIIGARMAIRDVMRAERHEGWREGYGDGREDYAAAVELKREAGRARLDLTWLGETPRGEKQTGHWQVQAAHLPSLVEDRFETGWRMLQVIEGSREIAGIHAHPDKPGELQWFVRDREDDDG